MRQYEMYEISLQHDAPEGSETDALCSAAFTMNNKTVKVDGFYAGNGLYKARFYPTETGVCTWELSVNNTTVTGVADCQPVAKGHHGRIQAKGVHFYYEDGTPFYPFGTTVYAFLHQEKERIEETFSTLEDAPFNKLRMCVFPKHYVFNRNEPELFAFERTENGFDFTRPVFAFWDAFDEILMRLDNMGIQADLILFHPYDHWGFAHMTEPECMQYLSYLLCRISAFPNLWWSLANEYDLLHDFEDERWPKIAAFIGKTDIWHHLLSNHNWVKPWDFSEINTTHCCLQSSDGIQIPSLQKKFGKPVMLDEMGYEGNIPYGWGNLSGFELVNRFWKAITHGGYASHGETFMEHMDDDQVLWWSKGGTLKGESPQRIHFLRNLVESFPGPPSVYSPKTDISFETKAELKALIDRGQQGIADNDVMIALAKLDEEEFERIRNFMIQPVVHYEDQVFLMYFGEMQTIYGEIILPEDAVFRIELIDVWAMTREVLMEKVNGNVELSLPGKAGIAVLATRM